MLVNFMTVLSLPALSSSAALVLFFSTSSFFLSFSSSSFSFYISFFFFSFSFYISFFFSYSPSPFALSSSAAQQVVRQNGLWQIIHLSPFCHHFHIFSSK